MISKYPLKKHPNIKRDLRLKTLTKTHKSAYLYGEFPIPRMFDSHYISHTDSYGNSDPRRSLIPYPMAKAFARAIKEKL